MRLENTRHSMKFGDLPSFVRLGAKVANHGHKEAAEGGGPRPQGLDEPLMRRGILSSMHDDDYLMQCVSDCAELTMRCGARGRDNMPRGLCAPMSRCSTLSQFDKASTRSAVDIGPASLA
jgi:hypothetical protein